MSILSPLRCGGEISGMKLNALSPAERGRMPKKSDLLEVLFNLKSKGNVIWKIVQ